MHCMVMQPEEAVRMINEWVKKATDNHVDSIISASDINAETDLVLDRQCCLLQGHVATAVLHRRHEAAPVLPPGREPHHAGDHVDAQNAARRLHGRVQG
jgi:hypothetical protein